MMRYSVRNDETGVTQGPYDTIDEAHDRGMRHVAPGDRYSVWMMTANDVGAGTVVEEGRRSRE